MFNSKLVLLPFAFLLSNHAFSAELNLTPTYGYEYGMEYQLEKVDGDKFVERTFARLQGTVDWTPYENKKNGNQLDTEFKMGAIAGQYKGALNGEEFGTLKEFLSGFTGSATAKYTINNSYIDPFLGMTSEFEGIGGDHTKRYEWQYDALVGAKFNTSNDTNLIISYQNTLGHGMRYIKSGAADRKYRQDDGYAVAIIAQKNYPSGKSRSVRVKYEHFDDGKNATLDGVDIGYEPNTSNWLLSYKATF